MADMKLPDELFTPFNPNELVEDDTSPGYAAWPVYKNVVSVEQYADLFASPTSRDDSLPGSFGAFIKSTIETAKASPPDMRTWAQQMNIMPDPQAKNIIPWPELPPQMLRVIMSEHLAPKMIVGLRCADIARYAVPSHRPWMPGWMVETKKDTHTPTDADDADKKAAFDFLQNCTIETTDARVRDSMQLQGFPTFLETAVRDAMTFGAYAWWTDCDLKGRVKSFKCLSAFNIRLANQDGYNGDPNLYAVGVDDTNKVTHTFTRYELIWRPRTPRADATAGGYGYPEITQALTLIRGWTDAIELNVTTFNKNAIPPGILLSTGMWTARQLDVLSRIWRNMKSGITKSHNIPVIPIPKDGSLELLSLDTLVDKDAVYQDFINMLTGALCAVYKFPVTRLGYHASGRGPDSKEDKPTSEANVDMHDPGLAPELLQLENLVNEYLITPRWPHLVFSFTSKSPKDDARAYEIRMLAMSVSERRALVDLPALENIADKADKETAKTFGLAPVDPGLTSLFSAIVTSKIAAESAETTAAMKPQPEQGAPFSAKKDPVKSAAHGHASGVRRDSKAESK